MRLSSVYIFLLCFMLLFFFSSRRRHTRWPRDWSSDVCSSDLDILPTRKMAEFTVRLGTPAGEIVTRTVEALAANEARTRLEREGFKVFAVTPPKAHGVASLTRGGSAGGRSRVKANDLLLFNQQLAAL